MSRALEAIARYRAAGKKPAWVFILVADVPQPKFWLEDEPSSIDVVLPASQYALRVDLRPLVGCNVVVLGDDMSGTIKRLVERLIEIVETLHVCIVANLEASAGHLFVRGRGWRAI